MSVFTYTKTDMRCDNCGEKLRLKHDEFKHSDEAQCAKCGYVYRDCQRCGEWVGECDWEKGVEMCKNCWGMILDNNS